MPESMSCFTQHMLSGAVAGTTEHLAMYPVDTIKTRMQASSSRMNFAGLFGKIATREGLRGFYRGATAVALSAGPAHAVYFATYERVKDSIVPSTMSGAQTEGSWTTELFGFAFAGMTATMAADAVATPLDVVKQRMQLPDTRYRNVLDCSLTILRQEGVSAFFRSYRTTVFMNVPYTLIHFPVYEFSKRFLEPGKSKDPLLAVAEEASGEGEGTWMHMLAGGVAGATAAAATTPLDVVKTRMQIGYCVAQDRSSAILPVIQEVIRREGVGALWRGLLPRVLFHAPSTAICWASYEACKNFFGSKPGKSISHESSLQ